MRRFNIVIACCAVVAAAFGTVGVQAHHAFAASFDVNQPIELRGKISKVELINPHSWIHIDVTDADGSVNTWRIEGGSPNALYRNGVTKNSVPVGAELHIVGYRARDGSFRAVGRDITFADGKPLFFGGSQPQLPDAE